MLRVVEKYYALGQAVIVMGWLWPGLDFKFNGGLLEFDRFLNGVWGIL